MVITLSILGIERIFFNMIKGIYKKPIVSVKLNSETLGLRMWLSGKLLLYMHEALGLVPSTMKNKKQQWNTDNSVPQIRNKNIYFSVQLVWEVLIIATRKKMPRCKRRKIVFMDDMIIYVENPMSSNTHKTIRTTKCV